MKVRAGTNTSSVAEFLNKKQQAANLYIKSLSVVCIKKLVKNG